MKREVQEVAGRVRSLASNYLEENGIELIDIIYRREGQGTVLRLIVDTPSGITLNECEGLNNYLSELLDKEDVMGEHYLLEVSSPGLDRPIVTDRDFERSMGKILDVTTYRAVDGRKVHEGELIGMDKDNIVIESGGMSTVIPRKMIARARLELEI